MIQKSFLLNTPYLILCCIKTFYSWFLCSTSRHRIFPRVSFQLSPKDLAEEMVLELHQHLLAEVPGLKKTPFAAGWSRVGHSQIPPKKWWGEFWYTGIVPISKVPHRFFVGIAFRRTKTAQMNCDGGGWHCLGDISYLKGGEATSSQNCKDGWWLHITEKRSNVL